MLVIVPSRGRPNNVADLIRAWDATQANATLVVAVDDDDPELESYQKIATVMHEEYFQLVIGPRLRLAGTLNAVSMSRVMREGTLDTDIIGFMGDDHRPRTPHWDRDVKSAFSEVKHAIVYGNDLLQGPNLPTAVFMTAGMIKTLGYMVPPGLVHMYLDNVWKQWGQSMNRLVYRHNTIIEHMHPIAGKAQWDARYEEVNAGSQYADDECAFNEYIVSGLYEDEAKLRSLFHG
jgi:hypothetical protein